MSKNSNMGEAMEPIGVMRNLSEGTDKGNGGYRNHLRITEEKFKKRCCNMRIA